jgi:hypothetical protein
MTLHRDNVDTGEGVVDEGYVLAAERPAVHNERYLGG